MAAQRSGLTQALGADLKVSGNSKKCTSCGQDKPHTEFYEVASGKRASQCKPCKIASVTRRQAERYALDPSFRKAKIKRVTTRQSERYKVDSQYRNKTVAKVGVRQTVRYQSDPSFRLSKCMSSAIRESLREQKQGRSWERLVGYTTEQLKEHLEKLFRPGMNWENYGEWHIDHIVPIRHFEYISTAEMAFKECWSLSNLQPLWSVDNITKSDKLPSGTRARHYKKIST